MKIFSNNKHILEWLDYEKAESFNDADIIALDGKFEIHPLLYGEPKEHMYTVSCPYETMKYINLITQAKLQSKKIIGFGGNAHVICALSGGKILQHVIGHWIDHTVFLSNKSVITVQSEHHSLMNPYNLPENHYKILGASEGIVQNYQDFAQEDIELPLGFIEPEIVYFNKLNALAIESRIFYATKNLTDSKEAIKQLIDRYVRGKIKQEKNYI